MNEESQSARLVGIDTHAHTFTQQLKFVSAGEGYIPDYDAMLESFLQKLKEHRLSHAVLVQPSFLGSDNSHLMAAVKNHPEELRAIVIAGPDTPESELNTLRSQGAVGTRLILYGAAAEDYTTTRWKSFAERVASMNWVVAIYAGSAYLRSVCDPLLEAGCKIAIDHYGRPDPAKNVNDEGFQYLLGLAKTGRVWVDTSGPYRNGKGQLGLELSRKYFAALRERFGLERMLWGSDWPCVQFEPWASYKKSVAFLSDVLPDDADREQILWKTPAELFGFGLR